MKKCDLKKLALMGITGGVMLASQDANAANQNLGAEEHLAALSWTNNKQSCGGKDGCGGKKPTTTPGGQTTQKGTKPNRIVADAPDERGRGHSCGGKSGCGGSAGPKRKNTWEDRNTIGQNNGRGTETDQEPTKYPGGGGCGAKNGCGGGIKDQATSEHQFLNQLNAEGKKQFNELTPEGKQLAIRLSKQFADKNQAVKQAALQMDQLKKGPKAPNGSDNSNKRMNLTQ